MIRPIVTSPIALRMPSVDAGPEDAAVGQDLLDTLAAHADSCVGMAANMIGQRKRIIVVSDGGRALLMYNPRIIERANPYRAEEGCLSLPGTRGAERWRRIRVSYLDDAFRPVTRAFTGDTAQIIQHEVDHCDGVLI
ncbi:peptide deformylase [Candidatus Collinsella stercoripullorum]|uniref:peptide deformylase n=1 Tax=Candidatus Collinsella stercoripullorum TaxID=2838522 RepID=UPI0022E3EBEC|nr:peptide deformylase [Candidatus Collinsella stercoripullorum]